MARLDQVTAKRMGGLVTRRLPDGALLGDVSILHEHLPRATTLPCIHHERTSEFIYCTAGRMLARLGNRTYRIKAGDLILIPPGVKHQFITTSSPCEAISIFSPALDIAPGADIHRS